jgi:methylase of polypeptide subunit release factors
MDGLEHARVILNGARDRLKSGGLLGIELDSGRAGRVLGLAVEAGFRNARIERDPFGRPRYLLATKETA